jgi:microcystin degradation protein MlrC
MINRLRIGVVGLVHETNTFAPGMTEMDAFHNRIVEGKEAFYRRHEGTKTMMGGAIDGARKHDVELVPGFYADAVPSGMVSAATIEQLIQSVVNSVSEQLDGLLVILHGAMVSETYMDVEGELLRRLKERFTDSLPIAVSMDLHANMTQEMLNHANLWVGYNTYPHVDAYETTVEAMGLLVRMVRQEIVPYSYWEQSGMLVVPQTMITFEGAMSELMQQAFEMEKDPSVLNVTVLGGFPYSDIPDAGMSFIVTTDGDPKLAEALAKELGVAAWERREQFIVREFNVEEAIAKSLETIEGPDILIEGSDNIGGGGPADATHTLKLLLEIEARSLIVIRDVEAARKAHQQGVGTVLECDIGGKSGALHGEPVQIKGKIRLLFDGCYRFVGAYMTGRLAEMGKTAVVEAGQVTIILTENRSAPYDIGQVQSVGLDPYDYKMIVVKSAVAWRTAFGSIAKQEFYLDTPGACSSNLNHFTYEKLNRPIYPLDVPLNPIGRN